MSTELLYDINLWILFPILTIIYLLSIAIGFQLGKKNLEDKEKKEFLIFIFQISVLSLLALLLSFTFAMAAFRYEIRKALIVEESNAIYTVNLRTKILPVDAQQEIQELLRLYYKLRSEDLSAEYDEKKLKRFEKGAEKLQLQIWDKIIEASKSDPQANNIMPFLLEAVNHMIDLFSKREMALANHIPDIIFFLLFLASALTLLLTGYSLAVEKSRQFLPTLVLAALIITVTIVIIDLDGPRGGLIKVSLSNITNIRDFAIRPY